MSSDQRGIEERLRSNYSPTGVAVMQAIYSDDYLSIGGVESTDRLAELAAITSDDRILDIGCGVGGPAVRLAATKGCHVTGVDFIDTNIDEARQRALDADLEARLEFEVANAMELPFDEDGFDVVWGQDAWCHVPDKRQLLAEATRVLRPGGRIAFTDWVAGEDTRVSAEERERALAASLSPDAVTGSQYEALLRELGFSVTYEDLSPVFVGQYQQICDHLASNKDALVDRFSTRVFDLVEATNMAVLEGFVTGAIGGARFVARADAARS